MQPYETSRASVAQEMMSQCDHGNIPTTNISLWMTGNLSPCLVIMPQFFLKQKTLSVVCVCQNTALHNHALFAC